MRVCVPLAPVTLGPCTGDTGGHGRDVASGSPTEGTDGAILGFFLSFGFSA